MLHTLSRIQQKPTNPNNTIHILNSWHWTGEILHLRANYFPLIAPLSLKWKASLFHNEASDRQ